MDDCVIVCEKLSCGQINDVFRIFYLGVLVFVLTQGSQPSHYDKELWLPFVSTYLLHFNAIDDTMNLLWLKCNYLKYLLPFILSIK